MKPDADPKTAVGIAAPLDQELWTVNFFELVRFTVPVVTVTNPSVALAGTVASRNVAPVRVTVVAVTPLNFTTDDALNPCPRMPIFDPTLPAVSCSSTNAGSPVLTLKNVPVLLVPPPLVDP